MEKKVINVSKAENLVLLQFGAENLEDRFYEFVQDLTHKYINKVENEYHITTDYGEEFDGDGGEMWYDEVRELVMVMIYETIGKLYKK